MKTDKSANALKATAALVGSATDYTEIFSKCNGNNAAQKAHLRREYLRIAKMLHPDSYTDPDEILLAQESFTKMQALHAQAEKAIADGTYGTPKPKVIFETKKTKHTLGKKIVSGDISDVYHCTSEINGSSYPTILKITRSSKDNDLSSNEQAILLKLQKAKDEDNLNHFVTKLVDSFTYSDGTDDHNVTVLENPADGFLDLETLRNNHFPDGLCPLHVGWIWRRLLLSLEFAHQNSIIHGAVLPSNILIHPELHGVVLADWSYAVDNSKRSKNISVILGSKKDWYPPEVLKKDKAIPGTDIFLAAQSMIYLLGGDPVTKSFPDNVPIEFQRYFKGCTVNSTYGRPSDAIALLQEFDTLLKDIGTPYHPRKFMALAI